MNLPPGIPLQDDFLSLRRDPLFQEMEAFSDRFRREHAAPLRAYPVVPDPFHQWSREWEYPFVFSRLRRWAGLRTAFRTLDAGSGCTFFPFFLARAFPGAAVDCCDANAGLAPIFREINALSPSPVAFHPARLEETPFPDGAFDAVACVSVLEHAPDAVRIIGELRRILKAGGLLLVTFDVSRDRRAGIDEREAERLLGRLSSLFAWTDAVPPAERLRRGRRDEILSTPFIRAREPGLLPPWKPGLIDFLKNLRRGRLSARPFFDLTVFCGEWRG